ncbi:YeeE/YedE family protein [Lentibacter algarum]|uniref:YeeE/YedE family protein n=1 Tax=Lentibacter algarum TaxID=576131 RepID=UPI001C0A344B|nr:YeeE/YedE family protein [Lentibacter algarum]MBU2982805.1 YeeE/YedE family protein [Lentibacter algarum]
MFDTVSESTLMMLAGLFGGVLLGLAARLGRFCTLGAIEDFLYGNSGLRLRMWWLAIGVAVLGTYGLGAAGMVNIEQSIYLSIRWMPLASVLGGLMFGYGMALAGNCGFGALARLGGGDMRAFVLVLVMGVSAYAVLSGPLAGLRVLVFEQVDTTTPQGFAQALSGFAGLSASTLGMLVGGLIILLTLASPDLRSKPSSAFWGGIVGVAIVSGWAASGYISQNGFEAISPVSHSFSAPIGEALVYTMTASARAPTFAVGSVFGVLLGAFIGSLIKGHFRWEACEDPRELKRQIAGAALMGAGAVVAMGCTVGQGLSGFSTLSYSAPVTFAAIFAGAAFGLRQLIVGFQPAE